MAIQYVSGDLFANRFKADAFAHGCNCKGSMGAGIAVEFKARYPDMFEEYRRRCTTAPRQFNPGDVFLWKDPEKPWVFNLATQEDYWRARATYENVETCLSTMIAIADHESVHTIALPRIGAGHGGLSWKKVVAIIEQIGARWTGMLYVYETYAPEATV